MLSRHLSKGFFIEISWKCSCMKIKTLLHKWFQPIVYCVLPDVIIFFGYFRDWILKSHQFVSTPRDPNHLASFWKLKPTWNKCHCVLFSVCIKRNKFSKLILFYQIWWTDHLCVYLVTQRVTYSVQNIRGVPNRSVKKS